MDKNIKDYREKELKSFVIGNLILVLISSGLLNQIITITNETSAWATINTVLSSTIFSSVIYIFVFLADSFVPGKIKDSIIWYFGGKPGEHIFTDIETNLEDNRFTKSQAKKQYKDIYETIKGKDSKSEESKNLQNSAWYSIYKKHEKHAQISVSQRDFLLCRDMFIMVPFIMIGYLCLQWYRHQTISIIMIGIMGAEILLLWFMTRSKGRRFVYNVIAIDISENKTKEEKP